MNSHYIRIVNGEFVTTDIDNRTYEPLKNITKDMVKIKIEEELKTLKKPLKTRELIYSVISKMSGLKTKNVCSQVLKQEATDPLYQELLQFLLGLKQYQKLIESTRALKISESEFIVSDINGVVLKVQNESFNTAQLEELIDTFESNEAELTANKILKYILLQYFNVSKSSINFTNPVLQDLIEKIRSTKFFLEYMGSKIETGFKNGEIFIRLRKDYLPLPPNITVDALKEQMIWYVIENKTHSQKNEIIFESLKRLTGFKVVKKVSRYMPAYVGPNKIRKDVLIEDPLYKKLCKFLDTLPEYQENKARSLEILYEREAARKKASVLVKEQTFVDQTLFLHGMTFTHNMNHRRM